MSHDDSRIEVGGGSIPWVPVLFAVILIGLLVLGVAFASRTPFGAVVSAPPDAETAVKEYLGKSEQRFVVRTTFYNCGEFLESIRSGRQDLAVAAELGTWRPGFVPDGTPGNLTVLQASKEKDGEWRITSKPVPGAVYDPSPIETEDPSHPCNLTKPAPAN